jgi:hypothetical protein
VLGSRLGKTQANRRCLLRASVWFDLDSGQGPSCSSRSGSGSKHALEHDLERSLERSFGLGLECGFEHSLESNFVCCLEHCLEHGLERDLEHGLERDIEHGFERNLEHGLERGLDCSLESGSASWLEGWGVTCDGSHSRISGTLDCWFVRCLPKSELWDEKKPAIYLGIDPQLLRRELVVFEGMTV